MVESIAYLGPAPVVSEVSVDMADIGVGDESVREVEVGV